MTAARLGVTATSCENHGTADLWLTTLLRIDARFARRGIPRNEGPKANEPAAGTDLAFDVGRALLPVTALPGRSARPTFPKGLSCNCVRS